jgi:hypothetical protein
MIPSGLEHLACSYVLVYNGTHPVDNDNFPLNGSKYYSSSSIFFRLSFGICEIGTQV